MGEGDFDIVPKGYLEQHGQRQIWFLLSLCPGDISSWCKGQGSRFPQTYAGFSSGRKTLFLSQRVFIPWDTCLLAVGKACPF